MQDCAREKEREKKRREGAKEKNRNFRGAKLANRVSFLRIRKYYRKSFHQFAIFPLFCALWCTSLPRAWIITRAIRHTYVYLFIINFLPAVFLIAFPISSMKVQLCIYRLRVPYILITFFIAIIPSRAWSLVLTR